MEYIEDFLNNPVNRNRLISHKRKIGEWKKEQQEFVNQCFLKKRRQRQFLESIDDKHAFQFVTTRKQTRYRQQNYYRTSYTVHQEDDWLYVDWQWLVNKDRELMAINHETTLKKYHSQKQRNLMTPQLREEIMNVITTHVRFVGSSCLMEWVCKSTILFLLPKAGRRFLQIFRYYVPNAMLQKETRLFHHPKSK